MGNNIFNIKEDPRNPSPPQIYSWRIYFCALAAAMGSSMFGYDSAFIGGVLSLISFKRDFGLLDKSEAVTATLSANIVSTFQGGCFFGAIFIYWINERFGRRSSLMLAGMIFNVGVIMQLCGAGHIGLMYTGCAFTGLGVGSSSLVIPQYIAECSPPAIRGGLVGRAPNLL